MQLLDATLAMVLTLAALATIVTIIMEAALRASRMRKKNLVEVMKLLNKELDNGPLGLQPEDRWKFITSVIDNPANAAAEALTERLEKDELWTTSNNKKSLRDDSNQLTKDGLDLFLNQLGRDKAITSSKFHRTLKFISQLLGDNKRTSLYDKVSMEHILRRLVEIKAVQDKSKQAGKAFKKELERLARKYEEYGSAVSASFKRYARAWSMFVGVVFAIIVNVDGLRIFDAYLADANLVNAVINKQEFFSTNYKEAAVRQEKFDKAKMNVIEKRKAVDLAKTELKNAKDAVKKLKSDGEKIKNTTSESFKAKLETAVAVVKSAKEKLDKEMKELAQAQEVFNGMVSVKKIKENAQQAQQQLTELISLGIPMGWNFYPSCPHDNAKTKSTDQECMAISSENRVEWPRESSSFENWVANQSDSLTNWLNSDSAFARTLTTAYRDTSGFIKWLFTVAITGVLIGLGAPFWFDVAKRLAQVRQGLRRTASDEDRMSGNDADGTTKTRKQIVKDVIKDMPT
jgi:hypothetical protein